MKREPRITLFSTRQCTYCRQVKAFLKRHHISFMEQDVERDPRAFKAFRRAGGSGVPLILVGNRRLHGFEKGELATALRQAGFDV